MKLKWDLVAGQGNILISTTCVNPSILMDLDYSNLVGLVWESLWSSCSQNIFKSWFVPIPLYSLLDAALQADGSIAGDSGQDPEPLG